jgi:hypothetical protein
VEVRIERAQYESTTVRLAPGEVRHIRLTPKSL